MFYLTGISISFFLAFLLLTKRNKTLADKILFTWLLVMGIHLLMFYLFISERIYYYPWLLGIQAPMPLLHGPLLYLYAAALTDRLPLRKNFSLLHFIPAAVCIIYLANFFALPAAQKIFIFKHEGIGYENFMQVNVFAIMVSGITYVIWTSLLLKKHRLSILDQFSNTDKINLDWLQYLVYGIAAIWLVVIIRGSDEYIFTVVVLFVIFMGYFGITQTGIFTGAHSLPAAETEKMKRQGEIVAKDEFVQPVFSEEILPDKRKYSKSGLTSEAAEILHRKLLNLIDSEKIFKESELTLVELAARLETHPNYLSQVINEKEAKNFYDFINSLRVEEFKKTVSDPSNQKFTLLALALECGFNSKSSFNRYFKKITGKSPSEYMQQHSPQMQQQSR